MENEKIVFTTDDGEEILVYVIEQTRLSGVNYLLVSESPEDEDAEGVILRDTSKDTDSEASYEIVEDDETLEALGTGAAIDPVRLLGFRFAFADDYAKNIESGGSLSARNVKLHEYGTRDRRESTCACTTSFAPSFQPPGVSRISRTMSSER